MDLVRRPVLGHPTAPVFDALLTFDDPLLETVCPPNLLSGTKACGPALQPYPLALYVALVLRGNWS
jgi:hypothetical protein